MLTGGLEIFSEMCYNNSTFTEEGGIMRGMRYSPKEKEKALKMWLVEGNDILWVAKKTKCTERSLWRWKAQYD